MKKMAVCGAKPPAQMNMAITTDGDAPDIPWKPGKLRRRSADIAASISLAVASDFKNDPFRIGECVGVRAVYRAALAGKGDGAEALTADNGFPGLLLRFIIGMANGYGFGFVWQGEGTKNIGVPIFMNEGRQKIPGQCEGCIHGCWSLLRNARRNASS